MTFGPVSLYRLLCLNHDAPLSLPRITTLLSLTMGLYYLVLKSFPGLIDTQPAQSSFKCVISKWVKRENYIGRFQILVTGPENFFLLFSHIWKSSSKDAFWYKNLRIWSTFSLKISILVSRKKIFERGYSLRLFI